jgi:catechol 2,3-dioxygenase-like lactoylglutathione lyase family enzyme
MSFARPIDHLVLATNDLDAAGAFYEHLGFKVGTRNRHPWGTENRIVQFRGSFLELIAVGEDAAIPPHGEGAYSFGAFVRDYLDTFEGLAMLVLESKDAQADNADFKKSGIGGFEPCFFERKGVRPDGTPVEVSFSLAFAKNALSPCAGFFVCQQHRPENFWNIAAQQHPNGAAGISEVMMIAENPADHAEFLSHFTGQRDMQSTSAGLLVDTGRGIISVMSEASAAFRLGAIFDPIPTRLIGFTVIVPDLRALEGRLASGKIAYQTRSNSIVIPSDTAFGVSIAFEQA